MVTPVPQSDTATSSLEYTLGKAMLDQLEQETISTEDARLVAVDLLEVVGKLKEHQGTIPVLEELVAKWPFFQSVLETEKLRSSEGPASDDKIDSIRQQLAKYI